VGKSSNPHSSGQLGEHDELEGNEDVSTLPLATQWRMRGSRVGCHW
jgi:hypothetical protein